MVNSGRSSGRIHHEKTFSEPDAEPPERQPVFSSQRFDRPASVAKSTSGRTGGGQYTADELIAKLLNQGNGERTASRGSQRSTASDAIRRALEAEEPFHPSDLFTEGLDEWNDRSISMQLLKRAQTLSGSKKVQRNPSHTSARRVSDGSAWRASDASGGKGDEHVPISQQLVPELYSGTRHRLFHEFKQNEDFLSPTNEDGSPIDVPPEYATILNNAPNATLIHLVMLYHQALIKHGFKEEAERIGKHFHNLEAADLELLAADLQGIDILLRDGLLKYLMSITPYLPSIPKQVVRFNDVTFTSTVAIDPGYASMYTEAINIVKGPFKKPAVEKVMLLKDLKGYLMPGSLTLVIGTGGSGSSVIHEVLSGRGGGPGRTVTGDITYNGRNVHQIKSRRFVAVVGDSDVHFGGLTVRETLEFSRECSQYYRSHHFGDELKEIVGEALKAGQDPKLETNLSMIGLKRVADRAVANPLKPSLTEAERHRLSVAEMIAGTYAVYMFDQLNKGMDDSVTFDLITSVRIFTRVRSVTVLSTLIQPSQDVFDLFDRIIMLDRGQIVYQGPRHDCLPYFESIGYVKPRQLTVPEFLEEVTKSDGAMYLQPGFPRLDLDGFVAAYQNSDQYRDICRIVDSPEVLEDSWMEGSPPLGVTLVQSHPNKGSEGIVEPKTTLVASLNEKGGSLLEVSMTHTGKVHPGDEVVAVGGSTGMLNYVKVGGSNKDDINTDQASDYIRLQLERPLPESGAYNLQFSRDFVLEPWPEFLLLLNRELKTTWRNKLALLIRTVQILVLGFFVGFVFFQVHPTAPINQLSFNLLRSTFFVSLLDMTLFNVGQLPALIEERKIFYKQNGASFYRPSSYLFAKIVGGLPFGMAEATAWSIIVYFLTNLSLDQGGWHFWVFYVIISLTVINGGAMVRFLAAFAPTLVAANGILGMIVAIFIIFAGFLVPRLEVKHWWVWAYYIDPLQWGITALMVNEFNSKRYDALCSTLTRAQIAADMAQCVDRPNNSLGHAYLAKGQFFTSNGWIGVAIGCIVGWFCVWTFLTYLSLAKLRHVPKVIITPSAEAKVLRRSESMIAHDLEQQGPKLSLMATPVTLSWHELSYDVLVPGIAKTMHLLTYVSGWAEPGEMVGIVGATGAGKTILLNCLAGRGVQTARIGGQILVNGYPRNDDAFARVSGYVNKLEAYSPYMTVKEAIIFSSDVMLSKTTTVEERKLFVEQIIELMELKTVENHLVKSLGQSYLTMAASERLGVAVELARNPSIIFLDEPNLFLDARSSLHMTMVLKKIADSGRIVMVAMGMRTQRVLNCFSSVLILKRGGETVYWGPVGQDGEMIKGFFEAIPGTPLCPPNYCVTTFAIDVIGDGVQERKAVKDYAFEYRVNELALHNHLQLQSLRRGKENLGPEINDVSVGSSYWTRAGHILAKLQLFYWRNIAYTWARLLQSTILGLLLGSMFWRQNSSTTPGMNSKASGIFISTLLQCISNAQAVIPQVNLNKPSAAREKSARHYSIVLYSMAWTLGEIPHLALSTLVFASLFCGMSGTATQDASAFFRYWFLLFEVTLAITFFGIFLASASLLPQIAATLVTIFVGFWVATSGVVVPRRKVLHYVIWIFWTNPLQYALTAMHSVTFFCDTNTPDCANNGLNQACLTSAAACPTCHCERLQDTGKFVWLTMQYNRSLVYSNVKWYMLALFGFIVFFRVLTLVVTKYKSR